MKVLALAMVGLLLLAGCATTPGAAPTASAAAAIHPIDDREAELIAAKDNGEALAAYAIDLTLLAETMPDPESGRSLRMRAYQFARLAQERGSENPLLPLLLDEIRPDGTKVKRTFSSHADADAYVHEGEVQFGRRRFEQALQCYEHALEIDPSCWSAALYAGDVFFAQNKFEESLPYFERAIAIDPTKETPHRYRADALMKLDRHDEAGQGYIRSFVADPMNPISRKAFGDWLARRGLTPERPDTAFIEGSVGLENGNAAIKLNSDGINWITVAYVTARAKYIEEHKAGKETHRHTLGEEAEALRTLIAIEGEFSKTKPDDELLKLHRAKFDTLRQIERDGLLEAHILVDRVTQDLFQDYADYISAHHEKLAQYVSKYWLNLQ